VLLIINLYIKVIFFKKAPRNGLIIIIRENALKSIKLRRLGELVYKGL
jgi:hypothetical protein